jgi:peptide/nickel transport system substrate-binding protein
VDHACTLRAELLQHRVPRRRVRHDPFDGIHLNIEAVPLAAWSAQATGPAAKRPVTVFPTGTCGIDVSCSTTELLGSATLAAGSYNTADYAPPAVDKLITAGLSTTNPAQRFAAYSKLLERLASDVPYLPLMNQDYAIALNPKFRVAWYTANFAYGDYALLVRSAT